MSTIRKFRDIVGYFGDYTYQLAHSEPPIPPRSLRSHVMQNPSRSNYSRRGQRMLEDLSVVLKEVNQSVDHFEAALDMGSGAGCVLRWLIKRYPHINVAACDIHAPSINWLKSRFSTVDAYINQKEPPLKFMSKSFDLIWAFSLFTHLPEDQQFLWLEELQRIAKPNAALILTTHGIGAVKKFIESSHPYAIEPNILLHEQGFVFINYPWSSDYGITYHTQEYVRQHWYKYFEELAYLPAQLDSLQDMWLLTPRT